MSLFPDLVRSYEHAEVHIESPGSCADIYFLFVCCCQVGFV